MTRTETETATLINEARPMFEFREAVKALAWRGVPPTATEALVRTAAALQERGWALHKIQKIAVEVLEDTLVDEGRQFIQEALQNPDTKKAPDV